MGRMRAFVALDFPEEYQAGFAGVQMELQARLRSKISWVAPENIHLTLRFLGEIEDRQVEAVARCMRQAVGGVAPQVLRPQGLGAFPSVRRPKVLWLGVEGTLEGVREVFQRLEDALLKMGFAPEKRKFMPHITLGRVRRAEAGDDFARVLQEVKVPEFAPVRVEEIKLYQSRLTPQGAVYTELCSEYFSG